MKINSQEANAIFESNNYVVFRNYATPPDVSLFNRVYVLEKRIEDAEGFNFGPMRIMPKYFFETKSVNNFYNDCSELYGVKTTLLLIEGDPEGTGTDRHSDQSNVVHWQCAGKSEWTFYDNPKPGIETKVMLNAGDVIWFKKDTDHSVKNLEYKYSIIFNEVELLKKFLIKKYNEAGKEFV
jgi:hypothetical protein